MNLDDLKILQLVTRQGSFAAAARVLNKDPSLVSRTVANIERTLGLRLFQRTTRTLGLTEEGELYLRRIGPLLDEFDQALDAVSEAAREPAGTLRLTASVAFAHEGIVPHLPEFRATCPRIAVELLPTDANLDLAANGIDLAIRLTSVPQGDMIGTRLCVTRYRVCAAPTYIARHSPITRPRDLSDHACLRFALPDFRNRWRFRREGSEVIDVPVDGWLVIANALSLRRAALEGLGPVLLPDWLVGRDIKAGRLVDLLPDWQCTATGFETGAWALYPSRSFLPRKVRAMIDFLRARLNASPA